MNKIPKLRLKYFRNTKHKVEYNNWTYYKKCYRNHIKYYWLTNGGFTQERLIKLIPHIESFLSSTSYATIPYISNGRKIVLWTILLEMSELDSAYMQIVQDNLLDLSITTNGLAPNAYFYA
jgi:hypothetical protein